MAKINKKEQYSIQIQNEVNNFLRTGLDNKALSFVSITKVELSPDFSTATLYWDTFDPSKRGDIKVAMEKSLSRIRKHISSTLEIRHTPIMLAKYDSQFEDESTITNLLNEEKDQGRDF